jgi:hypothetical protein
MSAGVARTGYESSAEAVRFSTVGGVMQDVSFLARIY